MSVADRPIEPIEPVARRIAGDAGIGDRHIESVCAQRLFEHDRKGRILRQLISCRQAVAERDNVNGRGGCRRGSGLVGGGESGSMSTHNERETGAGERVESPGEMD